MNVDLTSFSGKIQLPTTQAVSQASLPPTQNTPKASTENSEIQNLWAELARVLTHETEVAPTDFAELLEEINSALGENDQKKLALMIQTDATESNAAVSDPNLLFFLKTLQAVINKGEPITPFLNAAYIVSTQGNSQDLKRFLTTIQEIIKEPLAHSSNDNYQKPSLLDLCAAFEAFYAAKSQKKLAQQAWYWFNLKWILGDQEHVTHQNKSDQASPLPLRSLPDGVEIDFARLALQEKVQKNTGEHSADVLAHLTKGTKETPIFKL
jgi:ElaB/YqjD/DUF883 family membrane-anchored ribosome-binding protein